MAVQTQDIGEAIAEIHRRCNSTSRPDAFLRLFAKFPHVSVWPIVVENWPGFDLIPHKKFESLFRKNADTWSKNAMTGADLELYDSLPEKVTVYRGGNGSTAARGLSWTLCPEVAERFAVGHRIFFNKSPAVVELQVDKRTVAFCCTERNESEVVLFSVPVVRLTKAQ